MKAPILFGILNITENSFSDGGKFLEPEKAIRQAFRLRKDSAQVIDIGAASSNPNAKVIPPELEISRLKQVFLTLQKKGFELSIDSFQPKVQRFSLKKKSCLSK